MYITEERDKIIRHRTTLILGIVPYSFSFSDVFLSKVGYWSWGLLDEPAVGWPVQALFERPVAKLNVKIAIDYHFSSVGEEYSMGSLTPVSSLLLSLRW